MSVFLKVLFCLTIWFEAASAFAQYRCGNSFQDTPCSSGNNVQSKFEAKGQVESKVQDAKQSPTAFAVVCSRWGKSALDVAWKREAGALREAQLAKPAAEISRKDYTTVVDSVYAKRGAAPIIRNEVEAECFVQKQQEADEAAVMAAMARKMSGNSGNGPNLTQPIGTKQSESNGNAPAQNVNEKKEKCTVLQDQLIDVKNNARRGGNIGSMEKLNDDRRRLEQQISRLAC